MTNTNKYIIAGGRDFTDYAYFNDWLGHFLPADKSNIEIVSGGAKGVDAMAEQFAQERNIPVKIFPADWKAYGRAAGRTRNAQMAEYGTMLIAFWDGKSPGTKSMIQLAFKHAVRKISVHHYVDKITFEAVYNDEFEKYKGAPELLKLDKRILQSKADRELFFNTLQNPPEPNAAMIDLMKKCENNVFNR
jgi:hypothetical protein